MSDLTIPEEAWDRAWIEVASVRDASPRLPNDADTGGVVTAALEAAAPLIVAACLDDLAAKADRTEKAITSLGFTDYAEGKAEGVRWAASTLRARASVLRGEGDTL